MKRLALVVCLLALPLLALTLADDARSAMEGNPARGASLYEACVPCHTLQPKAMAGKPAEALLQKMLGYQKMTTDNPKIQGMKKTLDPLNQQDLMDLAAYISKM